MPDTTAVPSAAATTGAVGDPYLLPGIGDLSAFAVPSQGIVPTLPGVLAGSAPTVPVAPRGSVPGWPQQAPSVPDLGWSARRHPGVAPEGDEGNYYFLSDPVPQLPDEHEVFDVDAVRADFPILRETVNGKPLIWFDNAATTQKPQVVIDRLAYFYAHENSNIHRAAHELAARATDAYEEARGTVRRFIGASKSEEIIFVRGTTEAINLVAYAWGGKHLSPGDEIVITHLEHHANIVPWQLLSQQTGAILKVAPVDDAGNLLMSQFEDLLGPKTKLVAATQVSNALGTVTPVDKIVELGHRYGARVLIDGAQSIPHLPVNVSELGADFFVFSGHKIYGPTGIGVLYGSEEALVETPPWQGGGNMIADVTLERSLYQGLPNKFEAGTGNIADAVGLGEALRYVRAPGHRPHRRPRACLAGLRDPTPGRHPRCPLGGHRNRKGQRAVVRAGRTRAARGGQSTQLRRHRGACRTPLRAADSASHGPGGHRSPLVRVLQHVRGNRRLHQRGTPDRRGWH